MLELGSVRPVDLRTLWPHEARDFTPWLADNLDSLGKALGLDLELTEQEGCVGSFFCDLVAKEIGRDRVVIIENQLEPANHGHLGQLMTYAAGKEASVVVWIAAEIRDEYQQTLIWLNSRTDAKTDFFGVVLEAFQIDNSRPAINFKIVASPNEWRKQSAQSSLKSSSGKYELYRSFFQNVIDELREKYRFTNSRIAQPQNWASFGSGFAGLSYGFNFAAGNRVRVELYIDSGDEAFNKAIFRALEVKKAAIECELGETLSWERLDNRRASRIATYRPGSIEDTESNLSQIHRWGIEELIKFKRVFGPLLDEGRREAQEELLRKAAVGDMLAPPYQG
jgi:Domain of unknown function (DUF4268)